jgi:capsular exopolysaccharide synthesis family protein
MTTPTILDDPASLATVRASEQSPRAQAETARTASAAVLTDVDDHLVAVHSPQSFEADQYRILRHFLDQHGGGPKRQVLGITSPTAGDGKTTTAVNLAVTLAQSPGARVVLIDADLRRPFVATSLGLDDRRGPGLAATALDPKLELEQLVRPTPFNVDVVPAGPSTPSAYRLFDSARVGQLLDQARRQYDHVVVDTPPVLLVPDCRLMSQWVDGFIVVVAAHRTPRKLLADGLSALEEEKLLGIVFNADDRPLSGYFGRYQGYYGYHQRHSESGRRSRWRWPWRRPARGRTQGWW